MAAGDHRRLLGVNPGRSRNWALARRQRRDYAIPTASQVYSESQKARNLSRDDRVSLTVDHDTPQVMQIDGLSMAARAHRVTDPAEAQRALELLMRRYPPQQGIEMAMPKPGEVAVFRVTPSVISVLDYSKGFAHTDLVECEAATPEPVLAD